MLRYDSTHGNFKGTINVVDDSTLEINGKKVNVVSKRDPAEIPWADLGADYVVEVFRRIHYLLKGCVPFEGWCKESDNFCPFS
ncbi:hypothetical protein Bca52824_076725 [Brassica carinata]|uniref:Glyceraldehyde 3-phosphate dehydrogenase NAD(P) binding domain-containing protein n=1 Tax=Brassica carinata TaxID=52824 RepID=A0A8X7TXT8_BRACI|nr:hypothetical protein Bca52824_076725 [Brassica carinata]